MIRRPRGGDPVGMTDVAMSLDDELHSRRRRYSALMVGTSSGKRSPADRPKHRSAAKVSIMTLLWKSARFELLHSGPRTLSRAPDYCVLSPECSASGLANTTGHNFAARELDSQEESSSPIGVILMQHAAHGGRQHRRDHQCAPAGALLLTRRRDDGQREAFIPLPLCRSPVRASSVRDPHSRSRRSWPS